MTITIAIPVHNGATYLRETLDSALHQSRPADEVLVVDDASTDGSAEIVRSYQNSRSINYVFNEKPTGYVDAWNRAARLSSGEYVAILHQDDLLDPQDLDLVDQAFRKFPAARHLYAGYKYIDAAGRTTKTSQDAGLSPRLIAGREYAKEYLRGVLKNVHLHRCPGVTTQRSLLVGQCEYRKEAGLIADDDFFIRAGHYTDVIGIDHPLASFRLHGESATSRLESLAFRLANDYVFALKFHHQNKEFLDDDGRRIITGLAARFINQLLYDGSRTGTSAWLANAVQLSHEMDLLVPEWRSAYLPAWSAPIWRMNGETGDVSGVARMYSKMLGAIINAKNFFRK